MQGLKNPLRNFHRGKAKYILSERFAQCPAYDQKKKKSKLDARSTAVTFVGYNVQSPAHLVHFCETRKVKRVTFLHKHTQRIKHSITSTHECPALVLLNDLSPNSVTQYRPSGEEWHFKTDQVA